MGLRPFLILAIGLDKLALISGPLPALFAMVSPLFLIGYHLTRKRHAQIIADLEKRNAKPTQPAS